MIASQEVTRNRGQLAPKPLFSQSPSTEEQSVTSKQL